MLEKLKALLTSVRFYIVTLSGIVFYLKGGEADGFTWALILESVQLWMAAIVALGTFDSISSKFGSAKK